MLTLETQGQLEKLILDEELLNQEQLEELKLAAIKNNRNLIAEAVETGAINEETLTKLLAKVNNVPYVDLSQAVVSPEILSLLSKEIAERYMAVPLGETKNRLAIAMIDPSNVQAVDYLASKIGRPLEIYMASQSGVERVLAQYAANLKDGVGEVIQGAIEDTAEKNPPAKPGDSADIAKVKTIVQDSPISRALSAILEYAVQAQASDVHIEPRENELVIRVRVDGILREIMKLPKSIEPALVSRVKILSSLKIDEHRVPQDGQFKIRVADKDVDLRIAIAPVVWGEQVVIRLLDKSGMVFELEKLGFRGRSLKTIREGIKRPYGMILSSGPTGSGKSTTLYALIKEIMNDTINIVTLEDPVEYKMPGVNQIQVNTAVGLTFETGLRSILRQDPNVVMVGEIRDHETAQLAVQAALTGHLVFSTVHTNSAAGVLPRLIDMGVEPFLIASTVNTVIGQRLVRRIDEKTKQSYQSSKPETESINKTLKDVLLGPDNTVENLGYETLPKYNENAYTLFKGVDSKEAPGGYKGRLGIYEVFSVSDRIGKLLGTNTTSSEVQKAAQEEGMLTMKQDGYLKALNGHTTLGEVGRVSDDS